MDPPWGGVGVGVGWLLMMIGDAMTPFDPVLACFSFIFFDVI